MRAWVIWLIATFLNANILAIAWFSPDGMVSPNPSLVAIITALFFLPKFGLLLCVRIADLPAWSLTLMRYLCLLTPLIFWLMFYQAIYGDKWLTMFVLVLSVIFACLSWFGFIGSLNPRDQRSSDA